MPSEPAALAIGSRRLLLAAASALASSAAWLLHPMGGVLAAGALFGLLVPGQHAQRRALRVLLMALGAAAALAVVFLSALFAMGGCDPATACAGGGFFVGLAVCLVAAAVLGTDLTFGAVMGSLASGAAAGAVFARAAEPFGFLLAQLVLQVGYAASHLGDRRERGAAATAVPVPEIRGIRL